ncbi:MAG: hypothetical protein COT18_12075 [Elusimicrobia bacterium CG08_land_8_20_14_0_20_59_10]|nr:MAG: hypothetical protein COT18_12075 [Elusimicrobia bacterium CG08_land_8_20_14_0_20_59_10]
MRKPEVLSSIRASALPPRVQEYLARIACGERGSALKAGLKKDPAGLAAEAGRLLAAAGRILDRPGDEALYITGFNPNNMAPGRFEAALAELRAAAFLRREGFREISFIAQARGISADISGVKGGRGYVFEVCCLEAAAGQLPAAALLGVKYEKKKRQLNTARKKRGIRRGGLFFACNPLGLGAGVDEAALGKLARAVYEEKKSPAFTHLCLLSGSRGAFFPPWERAVGAVWRVE